MAISDQRRIPIIVLAVAGLILGLSCWGLYSSDGAVSARERDARLEQARSASGRATGAAPTPQVDFISAQRTPNSEILELSGALAPVQSTWVAAEIAGRIVEIPAHEHAPIAADGLLVRLDSALPKAEQIRAQAAHALAKAELERQRTLGSRSVASEAELDRAIAAERQSYAALIEARTRLEHTRITAPFDGIVNSLDLDLGTFVQPGTRIAEILDVRTLELTLAVSDRQIGAIEAGDAARVRIDALGSEIVPGRVARVGGAPQSDTMRYPVVVELDNTSGRMFPGMFAAVLLEVGKTASIRIPAQAVIREFELDYVFVIDSDGTARRKRVATRPVAFRPDLLEVERGLEDGDRVVTSGLSQLREGVRVEARAAAGSAS